MKRREFIKLIVSIGAGSAIFDPMEVVVKRALSAPRYFALHPFIESHPEAVFIKRTNVTSKTDSEAKRSEGEVLAKEIFTLRESGGIPLSSKLAIKPNLTCTNGRSNTEEGMGVITDPYFVEGMIDGIPGFAPENIYIREGNWLGDAFCPSEYKTSPYIGVAERTGVHLLDFPTGRKITELQFETLEEGSEVIWKECPDGIVFRRIGYVAPFNDEDSWLLNIAKFKAHGMGMTLCAKNLQGMCIHPHIHFCMGINSSIVDDFQPNVEESIERLHAKHLSDGIPRWDRPGKDWNSGYGMEMWSQKTCDSLSVTNTGLNIIEGIYGRNGNGFFEGPGSGNRAEDFLTNVIIFGKDPFKVDVIGTWLAGHEPGNFGLFHIAKERKLTNTINPRAIPVYLWEDGTPKLISLDDLERYPLLTYYLQRNYAGQNEPKYHLVNEPFDYGPSAVEPYEGHIESKDRNSRPEAKIIGQSFPNPFNGTTTIEYSLPKEGHVAIEIYDVRGHRVDVLIDQWQGKGTHVVQWDAHDMPSGVYFYVFRTDGLEKVGKMVLVR